MDALGSLEIFLFEGFRLDRRSGVLFQLDQAGSEEVVPLGARALDLLALLVARRGELLSKDEIMAAVWPGRTVEEANLSVQISKLRHILDRNRPQGSCIQTVTGYGYRFSVEVTQVENTALPRICGPAESADGAVNLNSERPSWPEPARGVSSGQLLPRLRMSHGFGVLACLIGGLGLVTLLTGALDWRSPWSREANPQPPPLSIVVLPFANLGDHEEQQYFADGVTEDLTTDLSRIGQLSVISHNTALTYRDRPVDTRQVGRELGVRYVLEGGVQRSGNEIHISAQLSEARTAVNLWSERFDRDIGELFVVRDEITRRIAVAVNRELVLADAVRPTKYPGVLDYVLQGRAVLMERPTRESRKEAIDLFERALERDPGSVTALSWLARTLSTRAADGMTTSAAADVARAEELVGKALTESPRSPLAHYARGTVLRAQDRFDEAIPEYETVIDFDRDWLDAYANLGQCKLYSGSPEQAIPLLKQAVHLSPRDPMIGVWLARIGLAELLRSHTDKAIYWLEKARNADPGLPYIYSRLAAAHALEGETDRAAAELAEARSLSGDARYSNIEHLRTGYLGVPKIRALYEDVYFAGLRLAGVPQK
jgi:TolB-like protein/DNA-binding winged helix-turn-helix (wHTH) protein/Tfp pilus assembly protein PilF